MTAPSSPSIPLDAEAARLLDALPALLDGRPAVLVTVLNVRGSAPRAPGARLLTRDGALLGGTIGGGHLEQIAIDQAMPLLAAWRTTSDGPHHHQERFALGAALGQCCGGAVTIGWQLVSPASTREANEQVQLAGTTRTEDERGTTLRTEIGDTLLLEHRDEPWTALIFGAGHVGRALAQVLTVLPWRVVLCDSRAEQLAALPPELRTERICAQPVHALQAWGWPLQWGELQPGNEPTQAAMRPAPAAQRTMALVMTHDHTLDRELVAALLAARDRDGTPLAFVGLIGSRSKIAGTRQLLADRVAEPDLARLVAPIGVRGGDGALVGGKTPAEIAIATAAQLIDVAARADT